MMKTQQKQTNCKHNSTLKVITTIFLDREVNCLPLGYYRLPSSLPLPWSTSPLSNSCPAVVLQDLSDCCNGCFPVR